MLEEGPVLVGAMVVMSVVVTMSGSRTVDGVLARGRPCMSAFTWTPAWWRHGSGDHGLTERRPQHSLLVSTLLGLMVVL
jgi:hypothetical protein